MSNTDQCLLNLTAYQPYESVFQEFKDSSQQSGKYYEIIDCFKILDVPQVSTIGYAFDHSLYRLVNNLEKKKTINLLRNIAIAYPTYLTPLEELEKKHKSGNYVNFKKTMIDKSAFPENNDSKLVFSILLYQIYVFLFNYMKLYPQSFQASIGNSESLIYILLHNPLDSWENLATALSSGQTSKGFTSYHSGIALSTLLAKKGWQGVIKSQMEVCQNYIRYLGLYMSYQVYKKNESPMTPNQPLYPANFVAKKAPSLMTIKTPFAIAKDLNTFEVSDEDLEVTMHLLSDLNEEDKYDPVGNLLTLEELQSLIEKDSFINDLVKSETKLLYYKLGTYNKMKSDLEDNLSSSGGDIDPKVKAALERKMEIVLVLIKLITERIDNNGKKTYSQRITDKRQAVDQIINDKSDGILSIKGDSRENIRRDMYSQIYIFSKAPELYVKNFMNYTLMGPAGSGKTKLASVLAFMYNNLGILASNKFVVVTRADLVGGYIGHTAPKTRDYLERILEGVLLIDEAYQLSGCPDVKGDFSTGDFGAEAITEIVNFIDKNIGLSVILAAGYEAKITDCFLAINEGMKRRFPNNLRLLLYSSDNLYEILMNFISMKFGSELLTTSQKQYVKQLIGNFNKETYNDELMFSNQAGDMLNLSTRIMENFILFKSQGYTATEINQSFQQFFADKGIYVDFRG